MKRLEQGKIFGFVEGGFPEDDAGMIAVAADHPPGVLNGTLLEEISADELPAGIGNDRQHSKLIAGVHEGGRLRIMAADRGEPGLAKLFDVAILCAVGQGVTDIGMILMPIDADGKEFLAVDLQTALGIEVDVADADSG